MLMILVDVCLRIPRWNMMVNVPKYLHLYVYNVSVKYNIVHYQKIKDFFIILFFQYQQHFQFIIYLSKISIHYYIEHEKWIHVVMNI